MEIGDRRKETGGGIQKMEGRRQKMPVGI